MVGRRDWHIRGPGWKHRGRHLHRQGGRRDFEGWPGSLHYRWDLCNAFKRNRGKLHVVSLLLHFFVLFVMVVEVCFWFECYWSWSLVTLLWYRFYTIESSKEKWELPNKVMELTSIDSKSNGQHHDRSVVYIIQVCVLLRNDTAFQKE